MRRRTVLGRLWDGQENPGGNGDDTFVRGETPEPPPEPPADLALHGGTRTTSPELLDHSVIAVRGVTDARGETATITDANRPIPNPTRPPARPAPKRPEPSRPSPRRPDPPKRDVTRVRGEAAANGEDDTRTRGESAD